MRDIVTISLPEWMAVTLKKYSKERGFKSLSEYVLYLVREDEKMITEDEVYEMWMEAKEAWKEGNTTSLPWKEGLDYLSGLAWT